MEKGGGGRRRRGRARGRAIEDANAQAASDGRKPCMNCGKRYKLLNNKCWALDVNKNDRPKNYAKTPPGFGNSEN